MITKIESIIFIALIILCVIWFLTTTIITIIGLATKRFNINEAVMPISISYIGIGIIMLGFCIFKLVQ